MVGGVGGWVVGWVRAWAGGWLGGGPCLASAWPGMRTAWPLPPQSACRSSAAVAPAGYRLRLLASVFAPQHLVCHQTSFSLSLSTGCCPLHPALLLPAPQVNYFPSRFDPSRHAERFPTPAAPLSGPRTREVIAKENNFEQPGVRYRSWDAARQQRFVGRVADMLLDPRCTREIRRIWVGYLSQCDAGLGQKLAVRLQQGGAL